MLLNELELPEAQTRPCVYFLICEGKIIYVGQSRGLRSRVKDHSRYFEFDRVLYFECDDDQVNELERRLIFALEPPGNTEWCGRPRISTGFDPEDMLDGELAEQRISELALEDDKRLSISERPITALDLSPRAIRRLAFHNVRRVSDIEQMGLNGLLAIPGIGERSMLEIKRSMLSAGIEMKAG